MKKIKDKENILSNLFVWFSIIVFSLLSIIFLVKNHILLFLFSFIIITIISLKNNIKKFPLLLFIISFIIRLIAVLALNFPQISDAKTLLEAAKGFAKNDFSFSNLEYFKLWGYQTGFVIYEGLILKIFKNPFILKLLNVTYSSFLVLIVYYISKKITNEKTAKMVSLLYMVFPYHLYMNSILINHQVSALLLFLGILFIIKENKQTKDYVYASILIAISNILRPEAIIVIFSFLLFEIFKLKKETILKTCKNVFIFLLIYFTIGFSTSFAIQKLNINKVGLKNNYPLWKFVLGFNHESCGYYTDDDIKYLNNEKEAKKIIKKRILDSPIDTSKLFICKADKFWLQSDLFAKNGMYKNKIYKIGPLEISFLSILNIVSGFNKCIYLFTLFMAIYGIIINREKIVKNNSLYFVILMTVTFFVFLLIEIQARYAYFIQVCIFILSSYGYSKLIDKIKKIKLKNGVKL